MKISELQPKGKAELTAEVVDLGEIRTFNKSGKEGRVLNAKIKDDSGEVTLTLWNDEVDKVKKGSKISLKNGYVSEYQGELQVSAGKFGTLEVNESEEPSESESAPE